MPPHWSLRKRARYPDCASTRLGDWPGDVRGRASRSARLSRPKNKRPWPESRNTIVMPVTISSARQRPVKRLRWPRAGTLPFNDWNYALLRTVGLDGQPLAAWTGSRPTVNLRKAMSQPLPDQETVAKAARAAAQALRPQLQRIEQTSAWTRGYCAGWFDELDREKKSLGGNWDSAAQCYLALAAIHNGLTDLDPKKRRGLARAAAGRWRPSCAFLRISTARVIALPISANPISSLSRMTTMAMARIGPTVLAGMACLALLGLWNARPRAQRAQNKEAHARPQGRRASQEAAQVFRRRHVHPSVIPKGR